MDHYKLFIDGEFVEASDGGVMESIDPGTGQPFATVAKATQADAEKAIMAAKRAFDKGDWSGMSPQARSEIVYRFADEIAKQALRIAVTEAMDSGQIIRLASFWGALCQGMLRNLGYHAAHKFPWEEEIPFSGNPMAPGRDYIRREPIGVCVGIVPWNFPITQAVQKIAHAIIMGNTIVLKPASITSLTACIVGEAAQAAGIPKGVINILPGPGAELGKILCTHPAVDKISLTGSTEVGRTIMKLAADSVKKVTLELGGKSANIILDDANMEMATSGALYGTFFHAGQVCESGTRLLVQAKVYDEFVDMFKKKAEALKIGYQLLPDTHLGPLVSAAQLETVEGYVKLGLKEGAKIIAGGKRAEVPGQSEGYYYTPTIFTDVKNNMRIAQEEIFGPVVCVLKYDDDDEAIAIANDTIYGLGGGVSSTNLARAQRVVNGVRTGTMWINSWHDGGDLCPFGGYKQSGVGREFGESGLNEYTQVKRVHVNAYARPESVLPIWHLMMDDKKLGSVFPFNCQAKVISGKGIIDSISMEVARLKCSRAVILTDEGVSKAGLARRVQNALGDFHVGTYDKILQDADIDVIDDAAAFARKLNADCIVSVGGGSVIDSAKAVCVALKNGGKTIDHMATMRLTERQTPHISIPTTSGTGSEVTMAAVIKSKLSGRKESIFDPYIVPDVAILDPCFTVTLPASLTAQTAMDAMTHAIEALTCAMPNTISDGHAMHAIRLIKENLPKAIANGHDEDARLKLQIAATMAGWAFTTAPTGLVHAMAQTLGATESLPHGLGCGIILPAVMRWNVDHVTDKLAMAAEALGVKTVGMSDRDSALAAADDIEKLMKAVKHPIRLRDAGVPESALDIACFHALGDIGCLFNGRPVTDPGEVLAIYKQVY